MLVVTVPGTTFCLYTLEDVCWFIFTGSVAMETATGKWSFVYREFDWNSLDLYWVHWYSGGGGGVSLIRKPISVREDSLSFKKKFKNQGNYSSKQKKGVVHAEGKFIRIFSCNIYIWFTVLAARRNVGIFGKFSPISVAVLAKTLLKL